MFAVRLRRVRVANFVTKHVFASEGPDPEADAPKRFLEINHHPEVIFNNVNLRDANLSGPIVGGGFATAEPVDVWTGGFECQDRSRMNNHKRPLDAVCTEASGRSTKTLHASLRYMFQARPAAALMTKSERQ